MELAPGVSVVVEDEAVRDSIRLLLESNYYTAQCYDSVHTLLSNVRALEQKCVLCDACVEDIEDVKEGLSEDATLICLVEDEIQKKSACEVSRDTNDPRSLSLKIYTNFLQFFDRLITTA